ncbi:hypothetical protein KDN32_21435 [Nocardioides sp. J2M5]|uniref:hypothetical protein n=1 Tax=Nocardioides palaemonis TaxID=2829810 RepID=UPI001BAADD33|nr:hypothetical protein [Nocardioides palaemonis]MBS2940307.1 hypothetical protein [Nocardioides palaemonis]
MAEQTTPLAALHDEFDRARGVPADGGWAFAVSWRLLRRDVEPHQVCEGLEEALALVRETQESPEDLFGTPEEHSDALYDRWVAEGRLHLWDASSMTWPEVPAWGFGLASFWTGAFMVFLLLDGRTTLTWTLGWVLLPVGIGVLKAVVWATWDTLLRARGAAAAAIGTLGAIAAGASTLALANEWAKTVPLGTASTWSYLWVVAGCALLAAAAGRWADARPTPAPAIADVDEWSRQVGAILRGRYHLADVRVAKIIGDAHAIAADAGRTVQEECGTPEEFAAGFVPDHARQRRIEGTIWAIIAVAQGVSLVGDFGWFRAALATACLAIAWRLLHRDEEDGQSGR